MNKDLIRQFVKRSDPTIVEAGSHYGEDSQHFSLMWPNVHLYLFEPDRENIKKIRALNLKATLFEGAISDEDGEATFYVAGGLSSNPNRYGDASGSIQVPMLHKTVFDQIPFVEEYVVPTIRLDTFCALHRIDVIDFVWSDIQGAEERMIMGGLEIFRTKVKGFFTEYENVELYKGFCTLPRILELLPSFRVVEDYPGGVCGDALLANTIYD
jgi:FkbM family methyltransferase